MKNIKRKIFVATFILVAITLACVLIYKSNAKSTPVSSDVVNEDNTKSFETAKKEPLEVVSISSNYHEEFDEILKDVTIKSNSNYEEIVFTFGKYEYTLYNVKEDETYVVTAFFDEEEINLKVLSKKEVLQTENISFTKSVENGKIKGIITNNTEEEIYPNQVTIYFKDAKNIIHAKTLEYSGCFFEELVISPNETFTFEMEIPDGYSLVNEKDIIFKYSNLNFDGSYSTIELKENNNN